MRCDDSAQTHKARISIVLSFSLNIEFQEVYRVVISSQIRAEIHGFVSPHIRTGKLKCCDFPQIRT